MEVLIVVQSCTNAERKPYRGECERNSNARGIVIGGPFSLGAEAVELNTIDQLKLRIFASSEPGQAGSGRLSFKRLQKDLVERDIGGHLSKLREYVGLCYDA